MVALAKSSLKSSLSRAFPPRGVRGNGGRATDEARYSTSMTASIDEWSTGRVALDFEDASASAPSFNPDEFDDLDEEISEEERAQFEARVDQVVDLATAAESIGELRAEIAILESITPCSLTPAASTEGRSSGSRREKPASLSSGSSGTVDGRKIIAS